MAKVAAAHCNPKVSPKLNHNDRTNLNSPTINQSKIHLNEYSATADEVKKEIDKLYKKAFENFSNYCTEKNGLTKQGKPKGLQNFTKKEKCYHEFIYEISENTTMQECQELTKKIADLTGFTPLQIAIHRDETYKDKDEKEHTHYHAHAVFFTLDQENGLQLARREASLHKGNLSKIQTLTAETLKMKRGDNRYEKGEEQPNYIQDYKLYAQVQEQTKEKEKRLYAEIEKQRLELLEMAQKIKEKENLIKSMELALKQQESNLKEKEAEYYKKLADLEQTHDNIIQNLKAEYKQRLSFWKNIATFGKHNKKVNDDYEKAKNLTLGLIDTTEKGYKSEITKIKNELKEVKERENKQLSVINELKERITAYEKQSKKFGAWCEKHIELIGIENLKEILPKKAERLEKEKREKENLKDYFTEKEQNTKKERKGPVRNY